LRDTDAAGAQVVGERLRAAVEKLRIKNQGCPQGVVTVSVGAASAKLTGEVAAARLVKEADRALYGAKCAGRNRVELAARTRVAKPTRTKK
jgi:diguanylate cyclase (GGDEF)-like protein